MGEFGNGRLLISPQTSYAISLMLTPARYIVYRSSEMEELMITEEQVNNEVPTTLPPWESTGSLSPISRPSHPPPSPPLVYEDDAPVSLQPQSFSLSNRENPSLGTRGPLQVSAGRTSVPPSVSNPLEIPHRISNDTFSARTLRRCRPVGGESPPPMFMPGLPSLESLFLQPSRSSTPSSRLSSVSWEESRPPSIITAYESGMESPALETSYRGYEESLKAESLYDYSI